MGVANAVATGATGAMNAAANVAATQMTNSANKQIAQMNNAFNEKMLDKQISYNKEAYETQVGDQWKFYNDAKENAWKMYEDQKAYDSASAQRERLEAAGLNPYMMMQGGSAGSATSAGSTGAPAVGGMQGVTPPTATPYSADYSGIAAGLGSAIDTIQQLKNSASERGVKDASAANLRIEGKYIAAKRIAEVYKMYNDAKNDNERTALQGILTSIEKDFKSSQMEVNKETVAQKRAETKLLVTENLIKNQELDFLPQAQKMQLAQGAADIALKYSQKKLTDNQAEHEIQKLAETMARTELTNQKTWTERANTINAQLDNTSKQMENQFNSETYKARVNTIKVALMKAINEDIPFAPADAGYLVKPPRKKIRELQNYYPD